MEIQFRVKRKKNPFNRNEIINIFDQKDKKENGWERDFCVLTHDFVNVNNTFPISSLLNNRIYNICEEFYMMETRLVC